MSLVFDPDANCGGVTQTGWLSREQIAEVNQYICKLMEIAGSSGTGEKLYALTVLLTPLQRKGSAHLEKLILSE